ncbi:MAG: peptidoglycan-binding protein [Actinomycetes bacterium]
MDVLPLRHGDAGDAVRDLQQRLSALGFDTSAEPRGVFGLLTVTAVESFQQGRALPTSGVCDESTWTAVVEAGYVLGDRHLYLRSPMFRGDDVADLQRALGTLGFDAGRVDGILGPNTDRALRDFQLNAGFTTDGVCGREVLKGLSRLGTTPGRVTNVAGVREREHLRSQPPVLAGRRIIIGEAGGLDVLVSAIERVLHESGAVVAVLHHPHPSVQAVESNDFDADLYLGFSLIDQPPCEAAFYATAGFESAGGKQFATLLVEQLRSLPQLEVADPVGRWLPILRETRMPAVVCNLHPTDVVIQQTASLAACIHLAIHAWVSSPIDP